MSDKNLWTMPWRLFLSKHRLVNMSPLWGWVGGKLALSLDSIGGWQKAPLKMGQRSEFTFIHCRLLDETVCYFKQSWKKVHFLLWTLGWNVLTATQLPSGKITAGLSSLGTGLVLFGPVIPCAAPAVPAEQTRGGLPLLHTYCSHHRCCATPSSGFAPCNHLRATVAFGALFSYSLLPHQPWHTGIHPPQDALIPGTLVACDWMGD